MESCSQIFCFCLPLGSISIYVSRGSRIAGSTPGSSVGTSKLKYGIFLVGASRIAPLKIASMIPRVSLMEIRFPVPFPSCIYEVSFRSALFHSLNELFCRFCRMQLKECLSETCGECRCRLCDTALCTGKFSCETGQEVVLCLLRCKYRYRRKYSESVS